MGGNAFTQPDISVVRIENDLYPELTAKYHFILDRFFAQVRLPPSAPNKPDHGDIDFLVSEPKSTQDDQKIEDVLAKALGAAAVYRNNAMISFAIPHPYRLTQHIQLDIQLCDPAYLPWLYFITSYGDLVPILGSIHHKLGLIINDKGFWVQLDLPKIPSGCGIPRSELVVFLTLDPDEMMKFLGLDVKAYREGFSDEEEIFQWIREGRYFRPISKRPANNTSSPEPANAGSENPSGDAQTPPKRRMLASFATFAQAYPPSDSSQSTPAQVALEAVTFFDKHAEYDTRQQSCLSEIQDYNFWQQMRNALTGGSSRKARIIKSLRKWVEVANGELRISDRAIERNTLSLRTQDEQERRLDWMKAHWEEVYEWEKAASERVSRDAGV